MALLIELAPEDEAAARKQAAERGQRLEDYLGALLQESILLKYGTPRPSVEEFERALDAFSECTEDLPVLTDAELTREALYTGRS